MDEFNNGFSEEKEFSQPDLDSEYSTPEPEAEYTLFTQDTVYHTESGKSESRIRRVMLYTAAAAVAVGLLTETPPPKTEPEPEPTPVVEYVEVQSDSVICCAVVRPDDPCTLYYYERLDWNSHNDFSNRNYISSNWYVVTEDGLETELDYIRHSEYDRDAFTAPDYEPDRYVSEYRLFGADESYDRNELLGWNGWGNQSVALLSSHIEPFQEGAFLKHVQRFEQDGEFRQMISTRRIEWLSPDPEIEVTMEAVPRDDQYSETHFRAVFRPREGDDHQFIFGEYPGFELDIDWINDNANFFYLASDQGALAIASFSTRWYNAEHQFLHSGWFNVASRDESWPFPSMEHVGRDYIFTYDGPVRSDAKDPSAAFYSVELHLVDATTGWHYLIESEQMPVTG